MAFVITEACVCVKDQACVAACPVDCILGAPGDPMMFIDPSLCVDCAACAPVCPVKAIYSLDNVPPDQALFVDMNRDYFTDREGTLRRLDATRHSKTENQP
jgi:ferredoxin